MPKIYLDSFKYKDKSKFEDGPSLGYKPLNIAATEFEISKKFEEKPKTEPSILQQFKFLFALG